MVIWGYLKALSPAARYLPQLEKTRHWKGREVGEARKWVCLASLGEYTTRYDPATNTRSPLTGFTCIALAFLLDVPITFSSCISSSEPGTDLDAWPSFLGVWATRFWRKGSFLSWPTWDGRGVLCWLVFGTIREAVG